MKISLLDEFSGLVESDEFSSTHVVGRDIVIGHTEVEWGGYILLRSSFRAVGPELGTVHEVGIYAGSLITVYCEYCVATNLHSLWYAYDIFYILIKRYDLDLLQIL